MFYLKANKHYDGYDIQAELGQHATRESAELEADRLAGESYVHDEGELRRATYVIVEDKANDTGRTGKASDGDGAEAVPAGTKAGGNHRPKRRSHKDSGDAGHRA